MQQQVLSSLLVYQHLKLLTWNSQEAAFLSTLTGKIFPLRVALPWVSLDSPGD